MKTFNYNINTDALKVSQAEANELHLHPERALETMLNLYLSARFTSGLTAPRSRAYQRLLTKLDEAAGNQIYDLELEDAEFDLLRDAFAHDDVRVRPEHVRLIGQYCAQIENTK